MWAPNDTRWLYLFVPFFFLVAGSIIYLHLSDDEVVPHPWMWEDEKALYVCDAPDWVLDVLDEAVSFVEPWAPYSDVVVTSSCFDIPDVVQCSFHQQMVPCAEGAVLLTSAGVGYDFGGTEDGGHGDESSLSVNGRTGSILFATIELPLRLEQIRRVVFIEKEDAFDVEASQWPSRVHFLVVAHALLHAEGYEHVFHELLGSVSAEPHGHIMASSIAGLGTDTSGLR